MSHGILVTETKNRSPSKWFHYPRQDAEGILPPVRDKLHILMSSIYGRTTIFSPRQLIARLYVVKRKSLCECSWQVCSWPSHLECASWDPNFWRLRTMKLVNFGRIQKESSIKSMYPISYIGHIVCRVNLEQRQRSEEYVSRTRDTCVGNVKRVQQRPPLDQFWVFKPVFQKSLNNVPDDCDFSTPWDPE